MGTFKDKITELSGKINKSYSSYAQTLTETYNGDYVRSIIDSIRKFGKYGRVYMKTIWIPIIKDKRIYKIDPSLYTTELIEYVKATKIGFVQVYNPINSTILRLGSTDFKDTTTESLDYGGLSSKVAMKLTIDGAYIKLGDGQITSITSNILDTNILSGTANGHTTIKLSYAVNVNDIVVNLNYVDSPDNAFASVVSCTLSSGKYIVELDRLNDWSTGDIVSATTGLPSLISVTFRCIPKFNYVTDSNFTTVNIPILPEFYDDIDHLALKYLYQILGSRDTEQIQIYTMQLKSGLLKSEEQIIREVKQRSATSDIPKTKCYNPLSTPKQLQPLVWVLESINYGH